MIRKTVIATLIGLSAVSISQANDKFVQFHSASNRPSLPRSERFDGQGVVVG
ncbi:hypothetical protein ACRQTN_15115 [Pectobacterium brasiliense]|uniref:hypothetical protein n=1 Tax=Pectobacterium brasiliense TaxID=180957 RepID=UPI003EB9D666